MSEAANKPAKKSWFKGLKAEFRKIVWPKKEKLARESVAVVIITVILGVVISFVDLLVKYGLNFILAI